MTLTIPVLRSGPPILTGVIVSRPEDDAERLLREVWWTNGPSQRELPVDPARIARELNVHVYTAAMEPDVSGALVGQRGQDPEIYLNERDSRTRKRFTCAHEIGHYRKRLADRDYTEFVDRRDVLASDGTNEHEIYANKFAAELLMPAVLVKEMWQEVPDPAILAYRFGVSGEAINYRLANLGLR